MFERLKVVMELLRVELNTVVDIGAHDGTWASTLRTMYPKARILSFEANPAMSGVLKSHVLDAFVPCVLGPEDGRTAHFHCDRSNPMSTGNSLFCESTDHFKDPIVVELTMSRLDSIQRIQQTPGIDLMKIDVQGGELLVLDGAPETLRKTRMVVLEVSFLEYNKGAPLFAEVIAYMTARAFRAVDVLDLHYCRGACLQADILFVREGDDMVASLESLFHASHAALSTK